jgi:hypothetical protein
MHDTVLLTKRYKILLTLIAVSVVTVVAMAFGFPEIAYMAAGSLVGYLGKMNGHTDKDPPQDGD